MTSLLADEVIAALLTQARELAEVRDSGGKLLGYFIPLDLYKFEVWAETATGRTDMVDGFQDEQSTTTVVTMRQLFEHLKGLSAARDEDRASLQQHIDSRVREAREVWQRRRDWLKQADGGGPTSPPEG